MNTTLDFCIPGLVTGAALCGVVDTTVLLVGEEGNGVAPIRSVICSAIFMNVCTELRC